MQLQLSDTGYACILISVYAAEDEVYKCFGSLRLQPFSFFEVVEDKERREYHQKKGPGISPFFIQFRHDIEVHPVDARDKRGGHEDDRYNGENFYDLVLFDVHVTQESVLQVVEAVEAEFDVLYQRVDVLNDDRELGLQFHRNEFATEHARYHPLLVDDVLTEHHGLFLQVFDLGK